MSSLASPELVFSQFKTRVINVVVGDARHLTRLENRLEEYAYIVSKHVMYGWNRDKCRREITNVVYVLAAKNGMERALNIMLTQLQKQANIELQILA